ncbi:MAG TPA: sigma-70 family RNA polymerase sigma factor [Labilithrix sp.]|nr:sigma-70 family RNA polymerase sigma factor [Labilithrix sp.]
MSVARPQPSKRDEPPSEGSVEAADPSGDAEGAADLEQSPPSSEIPPPSSSAPDLRKTPSHGPPPSPSVNTRVSDASNAKQARVREAEEDRGLIARAQAGDKVAFRSLVERHQRRAFAIALALVRDENDARELVQDAFLRVYKGLNSFQGGSSFFTWLYRIITNLSIDLIRKPGRQLVDIDESRFESDESVEAEFPLLSRVDGSDPADVVRRREIAARLQVALEALPPYHRGVIVMREIEGLSYEEMAQAMGVSKGTIMSRLFHARQKLQKALADCYVEQIGAIPDSDKASGSSEGES